MAILMINLVHRDQLSEKHAREDKSGNMALVLVKVGTRRLSNLKLKDGQ